MIHWRKICKTFTHPDFLDQGKTNEAEDAQLGARLVLLHLVRGLLVLMDDL